MAQEVSVKDFFKKIFGGKEAKEKNSAVEAKPALESREEKTLPRQVAEPVITAPLSDEVMAEIENPAYPPQLIVGCGQSVGKQRDQNEDALFTLTSNLASDTTDNSFGLFIIADGMGGHQHGEVASGIAIRSVANQVIRKLYIPLYGFDHQLPDESLQEVLLSSVMEAHRVILKEATGGGTTLTAALVVGNQLMISHVGDSRAYAIYPDGRFQTITRDHSLVKRLEELGQITSAEAAIHPQRNVLYRALGQGEPFEPDVITFPFPHKGHLMLCSDGLWGVITEKEMLDIIQSSPTPQEACHSMVKAANRAGGPDNISVILIRFPD